MKKKILSFMLVLALILPCVLMATACHSHEYTHGLCSCGDYVGTTIEVNGYEDLPEVGAGETIYVRYAIEKGQHYKYNVTMLGELTIKTYAKYNNWSTVGVNSTYYISIDAVPADGYLYMEISNNTQEAIADKSIYIDEDNHFVDTVNMSGYTHDLSSLIPGEEICLAKFLSVGTYTVELTFLDMMPTGEISGIYNNEGAVDYTEENGVLTFVVEEEREFFFHVYSNSGDIDELVITSL